MTNHSSRELSAFPCFGLDRLLLALLLAQLNGSAQTPVVVPQEIPPYSLSVSVNVVEVTFHAADAHNLPVLDLRPGEVEVFDNGSGPGQIISLRQLIERPIHAAFVIDTSGSVAMQIARSRAEAQQAAQKLMVTATDEGTAVAFGRSRHVVQDWTNQSNSVVKSIGEMGRRAYDPLDGTSVYDTMLSSCQFEFGKKADVTVGNVILLFSDGVDTASHATIQAAIDICRQSRTPIYAFSPKPLPGTSSRGSSTLRQLTEQTGGRLFYADNPDGDFQSDLDVVASNLRNEYLLLYRPKTLNHDGAFHRIVLVGPKRVTEIVGTSGFYDPSR